MESAIQIAVAGGSEQEMVGCVKSGNQPTGIERGKERGSTAPELTSRSNQTGRGQMERTK
ncbi:MAG: hypothetical protein A2Y38_08475 [Spirochaetes bacterium GWB1_59_5]|nr:MAG: hypothetical protein A2Y38_08475 [Spirochaetes bacterium GWB1_59_5]